MTSVPGSEERPAYDVLARKTIEILDVVNSTRQLLIEQYNNDQTMWMEAMFRILMWKNRAFLSDERNCSAKDPNVHKFLKDLILEMFRVMGDKNPPASDSIFCNQLLETGCNLISTFRVFSKFLLQSKLDLSDELANLQYIANNIEKYVKKQTDKAEEAKFAGQEKVKPVVGEPEKVKPTETVLANESQKAKPVANEPLKAKLVTSEPPKVKPASNELAKLKSVESQKVKPIGSENVRVDFSPKMKPATSKRNINEETFGSEAIKLALKDSVVVSEKRSTTPAKMGANDQMCEVCNDPIIVFNYDKEFSLLLHEDDPKHQRAVKNKVTHSGRDGSSAEPEEKISEVATRKILVDLVGETQARFFKIDVGDEFFCTLCRCIVYSTHNVVTHVQGRNHTKNCGLKSQESLRSQESKESRSGSDSRDLTSDEIDSADEGVLRVGSAIPVQSLFDLDPL